MEITLQTIFELLPSIFSVFVLPGVIFLWKLTSQLTILTDRMEHTQKTWREASERRNQQITQIQSDVADIETSLRNLERDNAVDHERLKNIVCPAVK